MTRSTTDYSDGELESIARELTGQPYDSLSRVQRAMIRDSLRDGAHPGDGLGDVFADVSVE